MCRTYVLEGPAKVGNIFGTYGKEVPEGKFVIVENGSYSNGGYGPSIVVQKFYETRAEAEAEMLKLKLR
jgi:hypothetical protein